jgi:predicted amidohydrolase YtcJ
MIVDSGIPVGTGTDSTNVAPLNPWLGIFYWTTGRNLAGNLTNAGRTITRLEALRLNTVGSAWFSKEEDELGSFEVGKLADLAVLSDDYLTVADEKLRRMTSVLTMQGGRVVHATAPFAELAPA